MTLLLVPVYTYIDSELEGISVIVLCLVDLLDNV